MQDKIHNYCMVKYKVKLQLCILPHTLLYKIVLYVQTCKQIFVTNPEQPSYSTLTVKVKMAYDKLQSTSYRDSNKKTSRFSPHLLASAVQKLQGKMPS